MDRLKLQLLHDAKYQSGEKRGDRMSVALLQVMECVSEAIEAACSLAYNGS